MIEIQHNLPVKKIKQKSVVVDSQYRAQVILSYSNNKKRSPVQCAWGLKSFIKWQINNRIMLHSDDIMSMGDVVGGKKLGYLATVAGKLTANTLASWEQCGATP